MRLSALSLVKVLVGECFVVVEHATHSPSPNSPMGASSPKSDMMSAGGCNARRLKRQVCDAETLHAVARPREHQIFHITSLT